MAALVTVKGPNVGRRYLLDGDTSLIGRQPDTQVHLESLAVSRHHARVVKDTAGYHVEDLGSSNGTYVNGHRIGGRVPLGERDVVTIGPYDLILQDDREPDVADSAHIIRARVDAQLSNATLFAQDSANRLRTMLEIARDLGRTLELDPMLGKLLEHLLRLFPQADRGMVLLCDGDRLVVHAQRTRKLGEEGDYPYSRTIVRKALDEGVGLLSEDVRGDRNLVLSATLVSLNLRSFLCVPLLGWENHRLGVIQLDCLRAGQVFKSEDLEMLTAIALQAGVVVQNAAYHVQRLKEERFHQELLMARNIQERFLPDRFDLIGPSAELFAHCVPAREVSGDLYDFFKLGDGRLGFFVGDVSGKAMPAALFMIAVRTLARHLGPSATGAADFLQKLNAALSENNPTHLYVTMIYGIYDGTDGSVLLASGGHPPPLLRRADGSVETVAVKPGLLVGQTPMPLRIADTRIVLAAGETLIFYTDGYFEPVAPDGKTQFGLEKLREGLGGARAEMPLDKCQQEVGAMIARHTASGELQDDQTMLLLRKR